eukprot:7075433-Lingulodinium_polyedra.AAC.1
MCIRDSRPSPARQLLPRARPIRPLPGQPVTRGDTAPTPPPRPRSPTSPGGLHGWRAPGPT